MNSTTSVYLDATRFMAAYFVFLHHLNDWSGQALPIFAPMQSQAVIVFFVLSGFVIAYVVDTKEKQLEDYTLSRLARIYSVAVPALIATFVLDAIASMAGPDLHQASNGPRLIVQFIAGLFFLNEVWSQHIPIGSNGPYWSLGYEVPYYIAFAGYVFGRRYWRYLLPALVLVAYGPRVTMLAPIWLMGVASYRICTQKVIAQRAGWLLLIGSTVLWIAFYAGIYLRIVPSSVVPLYWHHWEISEDFLVGTLFSLNVIGFHAVSAAFAPLALRCRGVVHWVAGTTFTLYLFHYPIVHCLLAVLRWQIEGARDMILLSLIVALIIFALAEVTERRKKFCRDLFGLVIRAT
jgi:peptidoglycan/LPS O-acetylase OafA/YrhL